MDTPKDKPKRVFSIVESENRAKWHNIPVKEGDTPPTPLPTVIPVENTSHSNEATGRVNPAFTPDLSSRSNEAVAAREVYQKEMDKTDLEVIKGSPKEVPTPIAKSSVELAAIAANIQYTDTYIQSLINISVPSELRNIGYTPGATGTQFLQLPAGWVTAKWGPGGGTDEITVITDVRYDATTKQLQKKTRRVKVAFITGESESAWTMISGGQAEECP